MKRNSIFFFLFLTFNLWAQPEIDWGPFQWNPHRKSSHVWVTTEDSNTVYLIKRKYGFKAKLMWYIDAIDKKTKALTYSKRIVEPLGQHKSFTKINTIISLGSKLYLFTSAYEESTGVLSSYATAINKSNGINGGTTLVYSAVVKTANDPDFNYVTTPDANELLICCTPFNMEENEMKLIDENLNTVWKGKIKIKSDKKILKKYNLTIDQSENIIIYSNEINSITIFSPNKEQLKTIKVVVPDQTVIYNSLLRVKETNTVYFVALLKTNQYQVTMGLITATLDCMNQKVLESETAILDSTQFREITGINRGWKEEIGLFYIQDVFFRANKDVTIIAEQKGAQLSSFPNGLYDNYYPRHMSLYTALQSGYMYVGSYYYTAPVLEYTANLISVFNLSFSGNLQWIKIIPKNQIFPASEYLSYIATFDNEKIYLIYNDNPSNINAVLPFGPRKLTNPKRAVGVLSTIDNSGKIINEPFYYRKWNDKLMLKPGTSIATGSNKILLLAERKKIFRLGEITLH